MARRLFHLWLCFSLAITVAWGVCRKCAPAAVEPSVHDCCKPAKPAHCGQSETKDDTSRKPCPNDSHGIKDFQKSESDLSKLNPMPSAPATETMQSLIDSERAASPLAAAARVTHPPPDRLALLSIFRI